jgi:hypothetical protein
MATWSINAITFPSNYVGRLDSVHSIFVNTNNTVYISGQGPQGKILIWPDEGNINELIIIQGTWSSSYALFVTMEGDIYVDSGSNDYQVKKWRNLRNTSAMYVGQSCYGLFVDISDTLYCSISRLHQVVTKSLNSVSSATILRAGSGCEGSFSNMLSNPRGIFVDIHLDLYVADCGNNRIQLFHSGDLNGTTVAGIQASGTIRLNCPTDVVLDADRYLFIVDSNNHRIVASGPNGFRTLFGYFGFGSAPNQLYYPQNMAFDSYGNIFVTGNSSVRIQKILLSRNSCSKYNNM